MAHILVDVPILAAWQVRVLVDGGDAFKVRRGEDDGPLARVADELRVVVRDDRARNEIGACGKVHQSRRRRARIARPAAAAQRRRARRFGGRSSGDRAVDRIGVVGDAVASRAIVSHVPKDAVVSCCGQERCVAVLLDLLQPERWHPVALALRARNTLLALNEKVGAVRFRLTAQTALSESAGTSVRSSVPLSASTWRLSAATEDMVHRRHFPGGVSGLPEGPSHAAARGFSRADGADAERESKRPYGDMACCNNVPFAPMLVRLPA